MLTALQNLAKNIAALREDGRQSGDAQTEFIADLMAARFTLMMDECAERYGALKGEMPWVRDFRNPPTNR